MTEKAKVSEYVIESQQPCVYISRGKTVNGYLITVYLPQWDEYVEVRCPSLAPSVVEKAVISIIKNREALDRLGS
jgi:hypothetical protein